MTAAKIIVEPVASSFEPVASSSSAVEVVRRKRPVFLQEPVAVDLDEESLSPARVLDEMLRESESEYEASGSESEADSEASIAASLIKSTKAQRATHVGVQSKGRRKCKGSGLKKAANVSGKLNCPFPDCDFSTIWMGSMRSHLINKHELSATDDKLKASNFKAKRVEICRFCGLEQRNRARHELNSCLSNPGSKQALLSKQRRKTKGRRALSSALSAFVAPCVNAGSSSTAFRKGAPIFLAKLKCFLNPETNMISTLSTRTAGTYFNKSIEIVSFWEESTPEFFMDQVIDFAGENQTFLPSPESYLESVSSWAVKHSAMNAYSKMIVCIKEILRKEFLNKIDHLTRYTPAESHLSSMTEVSRLLHKVINKKQGDDKVVMDRAKVRTGALKISTERMTNILRAYHQSVHVTQLKKLIAEQGIAVAVERRVIEGGQLGNFIMSLLLIGTGGHRGEAIRKIRMEEYENAPLTNGVKVVQVFDHKTAKSGAVMIPLTEQYVAALIDEYITNARVDFRPATVASGDKIPRTFGEEPLFTNQNGSMVNDMRGVVVFIRQTLSLKIKFHDVPDDFSASAVRTWVANVFRDEPDAFVRMNHSSATHDRHYVAAHLEKGYTWSLKVLNVLGGSEPIQHGGDMIDLVEPSEDQLEANESDNDGAVAHSTSKVSKTKVAPVVDPVSAAATAAALCRPELPPFSARLQKLTPQERDIVVRAMSDGIRNPSVSIKTINAALRFNGGVNDFVAVYNRLLSLKGSAKKVQGTIQSSLKRYKWPTDA